MDPFNQQAVPPPMPKPARPKKPDPAARRMKHLDYVALMLGVEPPPPDAELPPPVGYRFPDPVIDDPVLPPPIALVPPSVPPLRADAGVTDNSYHNHVLRMRGKMGF